MSDEGDRILGQIVRFVREIEREEGTTTPSGTVPPTAAFDGEWLKRWNRLIAKAEKHLASLTNKPN